MYACNENADSARVRGQKATAYRRVFFSRTSFSAIQTNRYSVPRNDSKTKKSTTADDDDLQPGRICMRIFMFVFVIYRVRRTSGKTMKRWWIVVVRRAAESGRTTESDDNGKTRRRYDLRASFLATSPSPVRARNPSRRRATCRPGVSAFYHHSFPVHRPENVCFQRRAQSGSWRIL